MSKKSSKEKKRILIVDDHPDDGQGLAQLIDHEPDLTTCSEADTAGQALEQAKQQYRTWFW